MKPNVRRPEIAGALRHAGLKRGDSVLLHSSLRSMGAVEGGAQAVIGAFLEILGPEGTLMAPAFNYVPGEYFDPRETPSLTGAITECLRGWPGALRSLHPTHSVAAIGARAAEYVEGHERAGALRIGSPVDKLANAGGCTVLLGVGHIANSAVHVGESLAHPPYVGLPYLPDRPTEARIATGDGAFLTVPLFEQPGCSRGFGAIEMPLRQAGAILDFKIGPAFCQLMRTRHVVERTVEAIHGQTDILLCTDPACYFCTHAREAIRCH